MMTGGSQTKVIVEMMIKSSKSDCSLYDLQSIDNNVSSKITPHREINQKMIRQLVDTSFQHF
jgi:hypothetical protein